jgi:hypothetical protein
MKSEMAPCSTHEKQYEKTANLQNGLRILRNSTSLTPLRNLDENSGGRVKELCTRLVAILPLDAFLGGSIRQGLPYLFPNTLDH